MWYQQIEHCDRQVSLCRVFHEVKYTHGKGKNVSALEGIKHYCADAEITLCMHTCSLHMYVQKRCFENSTREEMSWLMPTNVNLVSNFAFLKL